MPYLDKEAKVFGGWDQPSGIWGDRQGCSEAREKRGGSAQKCGCECATGAHDLMGERDTFHRRRRRYLVVLVGGVGQAGNSRRVKRGGAALSGCMEELNSSCIAWIDYDDAETLHIAFHSGRIYALRKVPVRHYYGLLRAASAGRYFNHHLRGRY